MNKCVALLLLLCAFRLNAQFTSIPAINRSNFVTVPTTPEAAKFQRYTDVPVNVSSGIPDIRVPVFTFALKDFTWNIDLSYYAGGHKVADFAGYTGLGWTLNYGGIISAKINGQDDLAFGNAANQLRRDLDVAAYPQIGGSALCTYSNQFDIATAELASDGFNTNYMPDVYYLNTNHFNTRFFLDADNGLSTMPASDIRINYTQGGGGVDFEVIDEQGNKFYFESVGWSNINMGLCAGGPFNPSYTYYLTRIETFYGESLTFSYTDLDYSYQTTDNEVKYVLPPYPNTSPCLQWASQPVGEGSLPLSRSCPVYGSAFEKLIQSISSSNGTTVEFTYSSRNDLSGGKKLDKIEVYNDAAGTNTLKKVVLLNYSYFGSGSNPDDLRLKLENVKYKAVDAEKYLQYTFEYNPTPLPNRLDKGIDWNGYYNAAGNASSLIPPIGNRNASLEFTKACVLEKIIYPTGGYAKYVYALNDGGVGGLRVASTENYDGVTDKILKKSYSYEEALMSGGPVTEEFRSYFMYKRPDHNFSELIDCYASKYSSQPPGDPYGSQGASYGKVTEYQGEGGKNGKIEYFFCSSSDLMVQHDLTFPGNPMKKKITYAYNPATASYETKLVEEFAYKVIKDDYAGYYANSSYVREKRAWGNPITYVHDELNSSSFGDSYCIPKLFFAGRMRLISAPLVLMREIKTQYENGQVSTDVADYSYGTNYESLKPVKISYSNSKELPTVHKLFYPNYLPNLNNYPLTPSEVLAYDDLLTGNRITMVGSEKEVDNKTVARKIATYGIKITTYGNYALPYRELLFENGTTLSSEVKITHNDDLNIVQLEDSRAPVKSFIWDYKKGYLAAEANNASVQQIAYTSFETSELGGWTLTSGSAVVNGGVTGNKCLNGGVTGVVPLGNYIVSCWSTGTVSVNDQPLTQAPVKIRGSWKYYEVQLQNVSTVKLSGSNIDEVRLHPKDAQMITYTHDPLIGITSRNDAINNIAYYEYDGLGRLLRVRDEEKNIIKQFEYQNQGSVTNGAVWQATGLTRCLPCDLNPAYTSIQQRQEINTNPNITVPPRWVDIGFAGNCGFPDWQNTNTPHRCIQSNGENTGQKEAEQKDMNPCSPTGLQTRWTNVGYDYDACPIPPYECDYNNCESQGEGFKCVNNNCEFGIKVYFLSNGYPDGTWVCWYRYEWSDGSWSAEYTEVSSYDCMNP